LSTQPCTYTGAPRKPFVHTGRVRAFLLLLRDGSYPTQAGRMVGWSRSHTFYYVKRLVKLGYLKRQVRDAATFYTLTQRCSNFLTGSEARGLPRVVRLHNFCAKYPIVAEPRVPVDWGRVQQMRNWEKVLGTVFGLTVERTTRHVLVYADVVEGGNPWELVYLAWRETDRLASYLEESWKMRLGRPSLKDPKLHFAVYDPVASRIVKDYRVTLDGVAEVDQSPPSPGEVDWFSPESAEDYLLMGARMRTVEQRTARMETNLEAVASSLREAVDALKTLPQELTRALVEAGGPAKPTPTEMRPI